jgi:hypothetical protein
MDFVISKQHYAKDGESGIFRLTSRLVFITVIANGTNKVDAVVRIGGSDGPLLISCSTKQSLQSPAPIAVPTSEVWYSVSGTDGALSVSEAVT